MFKSERTASERMVALERKVEEQRQALAALQREVAELKGKK